ncbi:gamma carbonic anhydrase family protein [Vagococcus salmoninarum]|uniref:Gamma carbonic anhydrase family protein n=1 Tax=Vagococcus salmoninarum TaxID=2739 RepID=A0A429ZKA7_9ENTE|nr:gamma carbonic anhydrase family protein [Vagococcus salmoninarum]MBE9390316.1 gamma carbonic anhydrase family protein [Vagococcus salmoninarum]RST94155.1 gamma carbonic anhydrase family protein [Vagococcus salmoninarum]
MSKDGIFIAKSADVVGKVKLKPASNIWFQAVLRGDYNEIIIGERTNIQDGAVVHVDHDHPVLIGADVTVGHNCIIHGCEVGNNVLVGMGATVMNGAVIGENTIIGANSLVTEGKQIPPNSLIMGSPAKFIRHLTPEEIAGITQNAAYYVENSQQFASQAFKQDSAGYVEVD